MLYWPGEGGAFLRFWGESGELKGKAETEQVSRSAHPTSCPTGIRSRIEAEGGESYLEWSPVRGISQNDEAPQGSGWFLMPQPRGLGRAA